MSGRMVWHTSAHTRVDSRAGSAGVCACRDDAMMFRVGEEKREEAVGRACSLYMTGVIYNT